MRCLAERYSGATVFIVPGSDVQKRFRTYLNYARSLAAFLKDHYGQDPYERYANIVESTLPLVRSISAKRISNEAKVRQYLKAGLSNLLCLYMDSRSEGFFEAKNAWTPVQGWYATHNLLCALGCYVSPGSVPDHDLSCRNAAQLVAQRKLLPYPWSAFVEADFVEGEPQFFHRGFRRTPRPVSNLSTPTPEKFEDYLALLLESTLERRARRKIRMEQKRYVKKGRIRRNLRQDEKKRIYRSAGPVTIFNALYRFRVRANYGNVDTFVEGCSSPLEAQEFAIALFEVVDASLATLEVLLCAYAGEDVYRKVLLELSRRHSSWEPVAVRTGLQLAT